MSATVVSIARDHWDHGRKMYLAVLRELADDETLPLVNRQLQAIETASAELLRIEGLINRNS